jgi:hypothetical protein
MNYPKSLQTAVYCQLLTNSTQIKFGTLSTCIQIAKCIPTINKEFDELKKLATEKEATDEEINEQINQIDEKWFASFPKFKIALLENISSEFISALNENKEQVKINVFEILNLIESNKIFDNK